MMNQDELSRRDFLRTTSVVAAGTVAGSLAGESQASAEQEKILNYNSQMGYRRLGKTGLMISEISLGGHWKAPWPEPKGTWWGKFIDEPSPVVPDPVAENRTEVVSACIDAGMNYLDLTGLAECMAFGAALKGRREKMIVGADDYKQCVRRDERCNVKAQLQNVEDCLRAVGTDYLDIWRPQAKLDGTNTDDHIKVMTETFHKLRDAGKARHLGVSSHNRRWLQHVVEHFPEFELVIFPCTAKTKEAGQAPTKENVFESEPAVRNGDLVQSIFEAAAQRNVGVITIKPFMAGSLFGGRQSRPDAPKDTGSKEQNELARLTLQCILNMNDAITAVIPGQSTVSEAKNAAMASATRRSAQSPAAAAWLRRVTDEQWACLPHEYAWLHQWEYI